MTKTNPRAKDIGILGQSCWLLAKWLGWTMLGWALAISITCLSLVLWDESKVFHYLVTLIHSQLTYLAKVANPQQINLTSQLLQSALHWLVVQHHSIGVVFAEGSEMLSQNTTQQYLAPGLSLITKALLLTTALILVRLLMTIWMLPLVGLLALVGLIDGLVQRDIRTFCGGRESALIYHRAKRYIAPLLMTGFFSYLVLPLPLLPPWLFLPTALLTSGAICMTTRSFKKYV